MLVIIISYYHHNHLHYRRDQIKNFNNQLSAYISVLNEVIIHLTYQSRELGVRLGLYLSAE